MAKITNMQSNKITDDYTQIKKSWARIVSDLKRETDLLKQFAAFKNFHFLNGDSLFDQEDMDSINEIFIADYTQILEYVSVLTELTEIPNADLTVYESNNDAFIANNSIDIESFGDRYRA